MVMQFSCCYLFDTGRYQRDFSFIFKNTHVRGLVDAQATDGLCIEEKNVFSPQDLPATVLEEQQAVILLFESSPAYAAHRALLDSMGLAEGKHYGNAESLFSSLDRMAPHDLNRGIMVWGTGNLAESFLRTYADFWREQLAPLCFVDNRRSAENQIFLGCPVRHPDDIDFSAHEQLPYIVVASAFYQDVKKQLEGYGLQEFRHFAHWSQMLARPSLMLRRVFSTPQISGPQCPLGENVEVRVDGVFPCSCAPFLHIPLGDICAEDMDSIWNSVQSDVFHLSLLNHTYCFCKLESCFYKQQLPVPATYNPEIINKIKIKRISLSLDETCNCYCPKCRLKPLGISPAHVVLRKSLLHSLLQTKTIKDADEFYLAGGGELFVSKVYEDFWAEEHGLKADRVFIVTNLQFFSLEKLAEIKKSFVNIDLTVSVDGASKETYEAIQRGGKFSVCQEKMQIVSSLRKNNELERLNITMVVQQDNVHEVPAMISWMESLGADSLALVKIRNWGTFAPDVFEAKISCFDEDLCIPKPQFREFFEKAAQHSGPMKVVIQ